MFTTNLKRIIKVGFLNFVRNSWLAAATISIIVLTLITITGLVLLSVVTQSIVANLQNKVDISAYFNSTASEKDILAVRDDLVKMKEVNSVSYVSKEEALKKFKEKHADNETLMQSLQELNENPLQASLNIKAQMASQYQGIVNFLEQDKYKSLIDKINYYQNEKVIARVSNLASTIGRGGLLASLILALMAIFVTFNTIRLTMYNWKDEISVMRLVGASNWYIRGPFIVEGVIYAVISFIITIIIFYSSMYFISPYVNNFFGGLNFFNYFVNNAFTFSLVIFVASIALGILSSLLAIRRYLKV